VWIEPRRRSYLTHVNFGHKTNVKAYDEEGGWGRKLKVTDVVYGRPFKGLRFYNVQIINFSIDTEPLEPFMHLIMKPFN